MGSAINNLVRVSLLAILVIGGQTSMCNLVSLIGLEAHHHEHPEGETTGICLESPSDCHDEEHVPCPNDCEIELSDTLLPDYLEAPSCPVVDQARAWVVGSESSVPRQTFDSPKTGDPPRPPNLSDRAFTGRLQV